MATSMLGCLPPPLSLPSVQMSSRLFAVLKSQAIKKYQLLFRHLFHCANIHRTLSDTWREHQKITATAAVPPAWLTLAYELRQRMIHFVHNLQHYACFEVVEPNWQKLEKQLGEATAIDDVLRDHNDFLDTCIKECLLTNPVLIKTISKILSVCEIFASYMKVRPSTSVNPSPSPPQPRLPRALPST